MSSRPRSTVVVKVATTQQTPPPLFDLESGVSKTISLIAQASQKGAQLIAFPECWLPGYPMFLWANNFRDNIPLVRRYTANSLSLDSPEFQRIRSAAAEHSINVMLGFSERSSSTPAAAPAAPAESGGGCSLYMAQTLISSAGAILLHRRKIKPTHMERTLFGEGSGDSVRNVVDVAAAAVEGLGEGGDGGCSRERVRMRVSGLQCWEHLQPLLKYHTYSQRPQIHVAAWPAGLPFSGGEEEPWSMTREACQTASRMVSLEGGCFTVVATQCNLMPDDDDDDDNNDAEGQKQVGGGFAAIYGPDGRKLTEDLGVGEEGILYAECDLGDAIQYAKGMNDVVGHYSRPDIFGLVVDAERKENVVMKGKESGDMLGRFGDLEEGGEKGRGRIEIGEK